MYNTMAILGVTPILTISDITEFMIIPTEAVSTMNVCTVYHVFFYKCETQIGW